MTAGGSRLVNATRHREHLPTLFQSETRGDHAATLVTRFNDNNCFAESGNDAVALWKGLSVGFASEIKLRPDTCAVSNFLHQIAVLGRIKFIETTTENCRGSTAC